MIAASWAWVLAGVVLLLGIGLLVTLAFGLLDLPGSFLRRAAQTAAAPRTEGGRPLPDEVPDASPAEAAERAESREDG